MNEAFLAIKRMNAILDIEAAANRVAHLAEVESKNLLKRAALLDIAAELGGLKRRLETIDEAGGPV